MEAPFELLIYVFLFGTFLTTIKYYFVYQQGTKELIYHLTLDDADSPKVCKNFIGIINPVRHFIILRQRKIPRSDGAQTSDDEGSRLLVFP
jgi:hypothetical protein